MYIDKSVLDKCARAAFDAENSLDLGQSMVAYDSRPSYLKNLYIIATRAAIEEYINIKNNSDD